MTKKLVANANHYPTKALRMIYVDSCVDGNAYKHLAVRSRISARKLFAIAEKMFEVLQKAYGDSNHAHTAANKFRDLKMTGDFNSFWTEFQVLASGLDHSKFIFIGKLKYKLTPSLSRAMVDGVLQSKNIHEYAKQCQQAYQDLKNIDRQTSAANPAGNQYNQGINTNTSTSINVNAKMANCSEHLANFIYSYPSSMALSPAMATRPAHSKATKLTKEEIAKLDAKTNVFTAKRLRTINCNAQKSGNQWQLSQTQHWHWLMLVRWPYLNQAMWRQKTSNPHNSCCGQWEAIVNFCL